MGDLRTLIGNVMLCIEIDENQHKSYAKNDDVSRYNELFMDFSGRYVFLRVNPDAYRMSGRKVNPSFETRLACVIEKLNELIDAIAQSDGMMATDVLVEVHHMFYDKT
jgi:DNA-binding GntR family transcriptional regulator